MDPKILYSRPSAQNRAVVQNKLRHPRHLNQERGVYETHLLQQSIMPARSCLVVLVDQRQVARGLARVVEATPKVRANAKLLIVIGIGVHTMVRCAMA